MTVYLKNGGQWRAASNGNIRVKWGGNWNTANYVYRKTNGVWQDSGYRGYPLAPQSIWVHAWSFSAVALGFTGPPAGGAPVAHYELLQTDSNGNWLSHVAVGGSPWGNFGVGEDGYYRFYVRSVSTGGLYSGWTGPVQVRIGHSEQGYWATEGRTAGWESEHLSGARNKDDPFWVGFGGNVIIQGMHWRNLRTPMSSIVRPGTNRDVSWVIYGQDYGSIGNNYGTVYSGSSIDHPFGHRGDGSPWGIVARGAGWSTTGNGTYMLWVDDFWCSGYYEYNVDVYYITRYYQDNGYW